MSELGKATTLSRPDLGSAGAVRAPEEGEGRLASIIETAGEAFVSIDVDGRIVEWNPQAEATFGWSRDEALGRALVETIIPPRHRAPHLQGMERFLATGDGPVLNRRVELSALHRDGHEFPVELAVSATRIGDEWTFNAFLHDISERRQAEEQLKRSELRLAQAQRVAHIGSWEWNTELDLMSWSNELYRIFGLEPQEFAGGYDSFLERVHPDDRDRVDATIRDALRNRRPVDIHHRIVRADGAVRVLHAQSEIIQNEAGPLRMCGTAHDVTDRMRVEEELELCRELALAIGETPTVEAALELILRRICERTGWVFGQAWVRNGSYLECSPAWYAGAPGLEPFRERSESMTFERGRGLAGEAWLTGEPIWMTDVKTNSRFTRTTFAREVGLGAGLAVPVPSADGVVAVMEFFVFEPRSEDEQLIALASAVAAQLGVLIERKRAEEALRQSEQCFRSLVESFQDHAIFMLDSSGHVTTWNSGAERITGYRADEIIGYHLSRLYPREAVEAGDPERHLDLAAAEGRFEQSDWRVRRDGLRFWASVDITPLRGDDGEIQGFSHVTRDITERKRIEEELERLGAIVEFSEDAIVGASVESGIVTTWNRGAERLFGYSAREIIGRPLHVLVPPEQVAAQAEIMDQVLKGQRIEQFETRYVRKNRALVDISLTVSPVKDLTGQVVGLSAIARDIGEHRQAQRSMERALGAYLDRDVADHILQAGPSLAGEEVDVTMMFMDVRNFTAFAARFDAGEVVATLNCLFDFAVPIIARHGGRIDKFVGDGLLAVFGAPRRQGDHACRAVEAALEIDGTYREQFKGDLEIGIGIDSGPVVAGNVGGGGRLDFTVIGNAVNTAACVEAATRTTGDTVLITEATRARIGDCRVALAPRPDVPLKGTDAPATLYAPRRAERVTAEEAEL
jgi:PAS domain S-box-containing protein